MVGSPTKKKKTFGGGGGRGGYEAFFLLTNGNSTLQGYKMCMNSKYYSSRFFFIYIYSPKLVLSLGYVGLET